MSSQPIIHIVLFKFDTAAVEGTITTTCQDFKSLATRCVTSQGKPYIQSLKAGKDMSIEGRTKGFTHAFVVTFDCIQDRDYYLNEDPVHAAFAKVYPRLSPKHRF